MSKTNEFTHEMSFDRVLNVTRQNLKARPKCGQGVNGEICRISGVDVDIPELEWGSITLAPKAGKRKTYPIPIGCS